MAKGKKPEEDEQSEEGGPKSSFEVYRAEADMLHKIGQYRKAIESYTTALELRNEDKYCLVARAKCYLHLGNSLEALHDAETSLKDDPEFPRGLFMKAEALYQMGKFEMALVYYHRGYNNRPEMHEFKVGIQKSEEAINNSIGPGNAEKLKRIEGLDLLDPEDDKTKRGARRPAQSQASRQATSIKVEYRSPEDDKASKLLLGQLYQDRQFLGSLLKEEENRPVKHAKQQQRVKELCTDGLSYLDNRTEFWRQQKPVSQRARQRRENAGRTTQATRDVYLNRLADVDIAFHRGDYDTALAQCRRLEAQVKKEPDVTFQYKPEIIAFIAHFMGNSLLEKGEFAKAMEYFNVERTYGEESDLAEAKGRAYDDIGRTYARMGEYQKAIDIWQQKLDGQITTKLAKTWLKHEIGRCHYELGRFTEALEYANEAVEHAKAENNRKWIVNCEVLAAQSYIQLNRLEEALQQFDMAYTESEGDEAVQKTVKTASEQLTRRIRETKTIDQHEDITTTYRVSLSLENLEYSSISGKAYIVMVGSDGNPTSPLPLGSFYKDDNPSDIELSAEPVHRRFENLDLVDLWVDGCSTFDVGSLRVDDIVSGKRWEVDGSNGSWQTRSEDPSKTLWRMTSIQIA